MAKIIPIKDLKNTSEISELCHQTDGPVYITKNGYGDMVIMSMESYEAMVQRLQMYKDLLESEKEIAAGKTKDARLSLNELKEKYAI